VRFKSASSHPEALTDGREVEPYGEFELSADQYKHPEQWRRLADGVFIGLSSAADKLIDDAKEDPAKYDGTVEITPEPTIQQEEVTP
jgi:hypothetical protein